MADREGVFPLADLTKSAKVGATSAGRFDQICKGGGISAGRFEQICKGRGAFLLADLGKSAVADLSKSAEVGGVFLPTDLSKSTRFEQLLVRRIGE